MAAAVVVSRRVAAPPIASFDRGGLGDHHLQRDPPQPAGAFGEIAGDIDGEGRVKFAHHRQREIAVVAIAVVEGEAGEAPREIAFGSAADAPRPWLTMSMSRARRCASIARRNSGVDLEMMVGLEFGVAARADMVQHENGADACEDRPQQIMRAGEIQRFQSGADDVVAELLHQGVAGRFGYDSELSEDR